MSNALGPGRGRAPTHLVCGLAVAVALAGCGGQVPQPTAAHVAAANARWPGTTLATLSHGRDLYVFRCSGCHSLVLPSSQSPDAWPAAVYEMSDRAHLTPTQTEAVIRYLVVAGTRSPPATR